MNQEQFEQEIKNVFWRYDETHPDFEAYWQFEEYVEWQTQLRSMANFHATDGGDYWLNQATDFLRDHHIGLDTDNVEAFEVARGQDYTR